MILAPAGPATSEAEVGFLAEMITNDVLAAVRLCDGPVNGDARRRTVEGSWDLRVGR